MRGMLDLNKSENAFGVSSADTPDPSLFAKIAYLKGVLDVCIPDTIVRDYCYDILRELTQNANENS